MKYPVSVLFVVSLASCVGGTESSSSNDSIGVDIDTIGVDGSAFTDIRASLDAGPPALGDAATGDMDTISGVDVVLPFDVLRTDIFPVDVGSNDSVEPTDTGGVIGDTFEDTQAISDTADIGTALTDVISDDVVVSDIDGSVDVELGDSDSEDGGVVPDTQEVADGSTDVVELPGPCCESHDGKGCELTSCSIAVCSVDPFCCETKWDTYCAACASGGATYDGQPCPLFFTMCGCEPIQEPEPSPFQIAEHWAPVWYHDTDDTNYPADYITAFDFDGNTVSADNWENLDDPTADLSAVIYWAFIETSTHWFISYLDFHPRDWANNCNPIIGEPCHENDMEGAMVVVRRDGTAFGKFEALYTEAHNTLHIHVNNPLITKASGHLEDEPVTFEDGSHPELYVEAKGHGVCALYYKGTSHCNHPTSGSPPPFPGGDGIVYRYKGQAEVPSGGNDSDVGYALVPLETTLWPLRFNTCGTGCTFDGTFEYAGVELAKAFDGDDYGDDKANPVWAWDDPSDGPVYRGDHFFRPAETLVTHLNIPGSVAQTYTVNPYLESF
jgi:hypothetical protein